MKISPADTAPSARPRGLENAVQRVQANMDRRAARAKAESAGGHIAGANALTQLQANLARKSGPVDGVEITPVEPAPPADPTQPTDPDNAIPAPAPLPSPDPSTGAGGLLDVLA
ncbi:MAG TPA: hypothetical protein VFF69_09730 [Phycisphaerales bacterium]|nr:hypothetical protein [Phycisphaerales bacterium]